MAFYVCFDWNPWLSANSTPSISYDRYSMRVSDKRLFVRSGAMHYFRLPGLATWRDRLQKLKAAGYNTVDLYFCWSYHSQAQGQYDFTGIRDVKALLDLVEELGLYLIARPGPYINAELSGGGLPGWLLADKTVIPRHRKNGQFVWNEPFWQATCEWMAKILPLLKNRPNLLLLQIENEYATEGMEEDYIRALYKLARSYDITVPLSHNDLYPFGCYGDVVDIYGMDHYAVTDFETDWKLEASNSLTQVDSFEETIRPYCESRPLYIAELQSGWFSPWQGATYQRIRRFLGREQLRLVTKSLVGQGLTMFSHYKAIGGTNWGYLGSTESYSSYDFAAPIHENGKLEEHYWEAKSLNLLLESFPGLNATNRVDTIENLPESLLKSPYLYAIRQEAEKKENHWLFFRNLSSEKVTLDWLNNETLTLPSYETLILPWHVALNPCQTLLYSTTEPILQTGKVLALKASETGSLAVKNEDGKIETLSWDELKPNEFQKNLVGETLVLLIGADLTDKTWLKPDGMVVIGPNTYDGASSFGFFSTGELYTVLPSGELTKKIITVDLPELKAPLLTNWQLFEALPKEKTLSPWQKPTSPEVDFDSLGLYEGALWYKITLNSKTPPELTLKASHLWGLWLNGTPVSNGVHWKSAPDQPEPQASQINLPASAYKPNEENHLLLLVDSLGHPKGFYDDAQEPGGLLTLKDNNNNDLRAALSFLPTTALPLQPLLWPSCFVVAQTEVLLTPEMITNTTWGLSLPEQSPLWDRLNIEINGILVGRYWKNCGAQTIFHLPEGFLQPGLNSLRLWLLNWETPQPATSWQEALKEVRWVCTRPPVAQISL